MSVTVVGLPGAPQAQLRTAGDVRLTRGHYGSARRSAPRVVPEPARPQTARASGQWGGGVPARLPPRLRKCAHRHLRSSASAKPSATRQKSTMAVPDCLGRVIGVRGRRRQGRSQPHRGGCRRHPGRAQTGRGLAATCRRPEPGAPTEHSPNHSLTPRPGRDMSGYRPLRARTDHVRPARSECGPPTR